MASQDTELTLLLEQLFFGRTVEVQQPLQVTVLGTDFGAAVVGTGNTVEQSLAASALDLARQTDSRNSGVAMANGDLNRTRVSGGVRPITGMTERMTGGGY